MNLAQVFAANPVTTIGPTDVFYIVTTDTTDAGINGANLLASIRSQSQGGLVWSVQTTTTQQMATNHGYISNDLSLVTYTLPPVAGTNPGDIIRIVGFEAGGWHLAQNAAQTIHFGSDSTTSGVTGFIASTSQHDCVELVALSGNDWVLTTSLGNITNA